MTLDFGPTKDEVLNLTHRRGRKPGSAYMDILREFLDSGNDAAKVNLDGKARRLVYDSMWKTAKRKGLSVIVTTRQDSIYLLRGD